MKKISFIAIPFLVLIFIFLIDKLALVPVIREAGRPGPTPLENMTQGMETTVATYKRDVAEGKNPGPMVLILGSSRSEKFRYLDPSDIKKDPYLSPAEKEKLLGSFFETRFSYKAADMFVTLVFFYHMVEVIGFAPEQLVLEISPEMFNQNAPSGMEKYLYENIYPVSFVRDTIPLFHGDVRQEMVHRFLFASYAFRFQPERALGSLLKKRGEGASGLVQALIGNRSPYEILPDSYTDFPVTGMSKKDYQKRFVEYADYLKNDFVMRDFAVSPNEIASFLEVLRLARKHGVTIHTWTPPVHPVLKKEWKKLPFRDADLTIKEALKQYDATYFDGWKNESRCNRFSDSSHLSARCSPSMMLQILEAEKLEGP